MIILEWAAMFLRGWRGGDLLIGDGENLPTQDLQWYKETFGWLVENEIDWDGI